MRVLALPTSIRIKLNCEALSYVAVQPSLTDAPSFALLLELGLLLELFVKLLCLDLGLQLDTIKVWPRSSFPRMASSRALAHANLYVILLVVD